MIDYKLWITHLSFQSTRKKTCDLWKFGEMLNKILSSLKQNPEIIYLQLLYKLIAHTRDIYGKGERDLSYMMIFIWYNHYPNHAVHALTCLNSVGCWKDIKYFCKWLRDHSDLGIDHPLILESIKIMNRQFNIDRQNGTCSMVAKWMPRESSAFGWLYEKMFSDWITTLPEEPSLRKKYRTEMSALNRRLDTPQIKQCEKKWSTIIPENVSMITKNRQCLAFLNEKGHSDVDRVICKEHFRYKNASCAANAFSMIEWMKDVFSLEIKPSEIKKQKLLSIWNALSLSLSKMGNIIPVLDLSIANRDDILGLVFMTMEKSYLSDRILIYDSFPTWFSFQHHPTIINKIDFFRRAIKEKGIGSDIYRAIDLIIDTCLKTLSPLLIEDMVFVVFTDNPYSHLEIMNRFQRAGVLSPPHFIYWNNSSQICDTPFDYVHSTLFSGDSSSLFFLLKQLFSDSDNSIHPIQKISSYEILCNTLQNPRYDCYDFLHK